jgi:hypothetical protein
MLIISCSINQKGFFNNVTCLESENMFSESRFGFYRIIDSQIIFNEQKYDRFVYLDSGLVVLDGYFSLEKNDTLLFISNEEYKNNCFVVRYFAVLSDSTTNFSYKIENKCKIPVLLSDVSIHTKVKQMESDSRKIFIVRHLIFEHMDHEFEESNTITRVFYINFDDGIVKMDYNLEQEQSMWIFFPYIPLSNIFLTPIDSVGNVPNRTLDEK